MKDNEKYAVVFFGMFSCTQNMTLVLTPLTFCRLSVIDEADSYFEDRTVDKVPGAHPITSFLNAWNGTDEGRGMFLYMGTNLPPDKLDGAIFDRLAIRGEFVRPSQAHIVQVTQRRLQEKMQEEQCPIRYDPRYTEEDFFATIKEIILDMAQVRESSRSSSRSTQEHTECKSFKSTCLPRFPDE